ncbi:MAG: hypothetical protein ACYDH6_13515 [Acidimicrobiales bacterium]
MAAELLAHGARVEVRSRFDGRWIRGYEIDRCDHGGYTVRRLSDDSVLPVVFTPEEIRLERRRTGLWWA